MAHCVTKIPWNAIILYYREIKCKKKFRFSGTLFCGKQALTACVFFLSVDSIWIHRFLCSHIYTLIRHSVAQIKLHSRNTLSFQSAAILVCSFSSVACLCINNFFVCVSWLLKNVTLCSEKKIKETRWLQLGKLKLSEKQGEVEIAMQDAMLDYRIDLSNFYCT